MYVRIARFEGGSFEDVQHQAELIQRDLQAVRDGGQPTTASRDLAEVVKRIEIFSGRESGSMLVAVYCDSEQDVRRADRLLDSMTPDRASSVRRISVDIYEVVLDFSMTQARAA